jgi:geranyl-CoA carboxylase alpha subunit
LCAEDPARNFLPQTGRVALWQAPPQIRVEHALESGQQISSYYDSMVAKLIAHAPSRDEARRLLARQLDACTLLGVPTNQDMLLDVLRHPEFVAGAANTGFIARHFSTFDTAASSAATPTPILALGLLLTLRQTRQPVRYPRELNGWSSCAPLRHSLSCELDGELHTLEVQAHGPDCWHVAYAAHAYDLVSQPHGERGLRIVVDGDAVELRYAQDGDAIYFRCGGRNHRLRDLSYVPPIAKNAVTGDGIVRAPMNGRVANVAVQAGQQVEAGQPLIVLEAMKMEHALLAPHAGSVLALHVTQGEQVEPGRVLAELTKL